MRLLSIFVLLLGLGACGLKGDLVIPEQDSEQHAENTQATS